jgi:TonB family protein
MITSRRRAWREVFLGLAACALATASAAPSRAAEGPGAEVVDIFMKALPYDRTFPDRSRDKLVVGVLARAGDPASQAEADRWEALLRGELRSRFRGTSSEVRKLAVRSIREAELATADRTYDLLFLAPGLSEEVPGLAAMAARRQVLLLALAPEDVARGAALGVDTRTQPTSLVSNPGAARLQGSDFAFSFLKLTRQVGEAEPAGAPARRLFQQQAVVLARRKAGEAPEYPPHALQRNKEAGLVAEILIDAEGKVRETTFLVSDPLFEGSVQEALRTWRFRPQLVNGAAVETVSVVKFDFKLDQR